MVHGTLLVEDTDETATPASRAKELAGVESRGRCTK